MSFGFNGSGCFPPDNQRWPSFADPCSCRPALLFLARLVRERALAECATRSERPRFAGIHKSEILVRTTEPRHGDPYSRQAVFAIGLHARKKPRKGCSP